jgi:hypothetical protein
LQQNRFYQFALDLAAPAETLIAMQPLPGENGKK